MASHHHDLPTEVKESWELLDKDVLKLSENKIKVESFGSYDVSPLGLPEHSKGFIFATQARGDHMTNVMVYRGPSKLEAENARATKEEWEKHNLEVPQNPGKSLQLVQLIHKDVQEEYNSDDNHYLI